MDVSSPDAIRENPTDRYPLLMEPPHDHESNDHVIEMERGGDPSPSSSVSSDNNTPGSNHNEERPSISPQIQITHSPSSSSSNVSNPRGSSLTRGGEGFGRRRWSPFNTMLWISFELIFTAGQIIAAIIVLSASRHENPQTPLFSWVVGYAAGCVASLLLLYWRYLNRNQATEQGSTRSRQGSSQSNSPAEPNSYITISLTQSSEEEEGQDTSTRIGNGPTIELPNAR